MDTQDAFVPERILRRWNGDLPVYGTERMKIYIAQWTTSIKRRIEKNFDIELSTIELIELRKIVDGVALQYFKNRDYRLMFFEEMVFRFLYQRYGFDPLEGDPDPDEINYVRCIHDRDHHWA